MTLFYNTPACKKNSTCTFCLEKEEFGVCVQNKSSLHHGDFPSQWGCTDFYPPNWTRSPFNLVTGLYIFYHFFNPVLRNIQHALSAFFFSLLRQQKCKIVFVPTEVRKKSTPQVHWCIVLRPLQNQWSHSHSGATT